MSAMSHREAGGAYYYQAAYSYFDDIIIGVLIS